MSVDFAASVAIIHCNKILLVKRSDVEAWALPEGRVELGESVADTAVREAQEETGLEIQLTRLVGIYYSPRWKYGDNHEVLFAAIPVGGLMAPQTGEVIEVGYFDPHSLPEPLLWWHRQRIYDAMSGVGGSVVWVQRVTWPFEGEGFSERLARSQLSREELFVQHFSKPEPEPADLEVLLIGG